MSRVRIAALMLAASTLLAACTPGGGPGAGSGGAGSDEPPASAPKAIAVALENEPKDPFVGSLFTGGGQIGANLRHAVHSSLAIYDERGALHPLMAAQLPDQEKGTWTLHPDGSMETTYKLKPGITWHDGTPLTPNDFIFGWQATRDPELPMSRRSVAPAIDDITAPDDLTLVLSWNKPFPFANALVQDEIGPMPSHLIEDVYRTDKERFAQLDYWTREFVGVGPYVLEEWAEGSHLTLKAFDRFFLGPPKIDTITVRFVASTPTAQANLLAGTLDGVIPRTLDFNSVMEVKRQWEGSGKQPAVFVNPTHFRILDVQFRPEMVNPREILDVRVRRALLMAIDRRGLVDALLAGTLPYADALVTPFDPRYEWAKDAIMKYPNDPSQAQAALESLGWRRGSDGFYANSVGERMTMELKTAQGEQSELEQNIIADNWRSAGIHVEQVVKTAAEARDNSTGSIFPAFHASAGPTTFDHITTRMRSSGCSSEQNRWTGPNHGCWVSAESDRTIEEMAGAIRQTDQARLWRELMKVFTEELPFLPLYYNPQVTIFREGIVGVKGETQPRTSPTWNIYEWDVQ
ncbi:MAG: hypothetical protein GEU73_12380 [Chloroflexi bacterium]|nr:hypothetical protein [Chloroflexota bacterium]